MKFGDKLSKVRKNNNLSQEQLADRLGMSRQAISKWESDLSYPDMATIIKLCKILNCSLDDLMEDDIIGNSDFTKTTKVNINIWIKDLLNFVTKTYNMFCSMKFIERIKCLIEMLMIVLVLYFIWIIGGNIVNVLLWRLLDLLPSIITNIIIYLFHLLYGIIGIVLGFIIAIHLFKIRYLDYFITIEDNYVKQKITEQPIKEIKEKLADQSNSIEKSREKIIIRDPKHSTLSFITSLGKILLLTIKAGAVLVIIPCIISFTFLSFFEMISILFIKEGMFFFGMVIAVLGLGILNYIILETIYNFVLNRSQHLKRFFILFISGLILTGFGFGISFCTYLTFTKIEEKEINDYQIIEKVFEVDSNLIIDFLNDEKIIIIIDNNISNIKVEVEYNAKLYNINIRSYSNEEQHIYLDYYSINDQGINMIKQLINDFKNKKIRDYRNYRYEKVKIYVSENNKQILENNYNNFYKDRYGY